MSQSPQAAKTTLSNKQSLLLALVLVGVLAVVLAVNHFARQAVTEVESDHTAQQAVPEVDPAVGVTLLTSGDPELPTVTVAHSDGMLVLDALVAAEQANHRWQFTYQGTGDKAFLTRLAGLESQGGDGRNWLYELNGELAQEGIGIQRVEPGDRVLWKFDTYE